MLKLLLQLISSRLQSQRLAKQADAAYHAPNPSAASTDGNLVSEDMLCTEALSTAGKIIFAHPMLASVTLQPHAWMALLTDCAGCCCSEELVAAVVVANGLGHNFQVCPQY